MSYGCSGKVSRRDAVKVGTLGILGMHLSLSDVLALEAQAATSPQGSGSKAKSVILIWLDGGPSQYDTFDPKPNAPSGVKSSFGAQSSYTEAPSCAPLHTPKAHMSVPAIYC
jgi:hypothetical protein